MSIQENILGIYFIVYTTPYPFLFDVKWFQRHTRNLKDLPENDKIIVIEFSNRLKNTIPDSLYNEICIIVLVLRCQKIS